MATILQDTFTDTNGTNLTSHTMDVGGGWTQDASLTGAVTIQSNRARMPSSTSVVHADSGETDYTLTMDAVAGMASGDDPTDCGFVFRYQNATNFWLARVAGAPGASRTADIYEQASGSYTLRAQQTPTAGYNTTGTMELEVAGTSAALTLGGGWSGSVSYGSMSSGGTQTKVGLWLRDINGTGLHDVDNFLADDGGGGPTFKDNTRNILHNVLGMAM